VQASRCFRDSQHYNNVGQENGALERFGKS
jgi:hypothetical protein